MEIKKIKKIKKSMKTKKSIKIEKIDFRQNVSKKFCHHDKVLTFNSVYI